MSKNPQLKTSPPTLHDNLKDFAGFTGPIAFDRKGDRVGDVYRLYQVDKDGKFVLVP